MSKIIGPNLVTSGLVLHLDAANPKSYVSGSTRWSDLSGNGNSGTLISGSGYTSANFGSITFDGVDDYSIINNPSNLQNQNMSISVWVNPITSANVITSLVDYDHAAAVNQGWVLQSADATTNNTYYFAYYDGSTFQPSTGIGAGIGIRLTNSTWQNLTYTKNGTSVVGYLNGAQVFTSSAGNANISYQPSRNLEVGGCVDTRIAVGTRYYKGKVTTVQVYNRALSAQEVLQNFNAVRGRFGI